MQVTIVLLLLTVRKASNRAYSQCEGPLVTLLFPLALQAGPDAIDLPTSLLIDEDCMAGGLMGENSDVPHSTRCWIVKRSECASQSS